jgi:hypothetical protein
MSPSSLKIIFGALLLTGCAFSTSEQQGTSDDATPVNAGDTAGGSGSTRAPGIGAGRGWGWGGGTGYTKSQNDGNDPQPSPWTEQGGDPNDPQPSPWTGGSSGGAAAGQRDPVLHHDEVRARTHL